MEQQPLKLSGYYRERERKENKTKQNNKNLFTKCTKMQGSITLIGTVSILWKNNFILTLQLPISDC